MIRTLVIACLYTVLLGNDVTCADSNESPDRRLVRELRRTAWEHRDELMEAVAIELNSQGVPSDVIQQYVTSALEGVDDVVEQAIPCSQCLVSDVRWYRGNRAHSAW